MRFTTSVYIILIGTITAIGCKQETKPDQPEAAVSIVQEMESPAGAGSSLPHLVTTETTTLLSWVTTQADTLSTLHYSKWGDDSWQKSETIIQGGDWFVNWADYPMLTENQGNLWSHILKKSTEGTYSYDVKMNVRPKGANEWNTNMDLHTDGTPTEHGFVSAVPFKDGFFVNWLDGRNTLENEQGERGAMTLRAGVVSAKGELLKEWELDARTCDCCQTTAAITDNGPVVLYRDRSADEIRDIYVVRQVNGEWTAPKSLHDDQWQIKGCPVNGPRAAAMGNTLAVAWFTGAAQRPRVQVSFSDDGGEEFQEPIVIAEGMIMGRVDVVWLDKTSAAVSWMEAEGKSAMLNMVKVSTNGTVSKKEVITTIEGSRKSGFPQMEKVDDQLFFAWTEQTDTTSTIRMAKIAVEAL